MRVIIVATLLIALSSISEPLICLCDYNLAELECERSANNTCTISSGRCVATFHLLGDAVSEEYSCYGIDQLREQNGICEGHFNNNNRVNLCCDDENLCNERFRLQNPFTTPTPALCPPLPELANGEISYSPDNTSNYNIGTVATYSCNHGYGLVINPVSEMRTCLDVGNGSGAIFSGQAPTCERTLSMGVIIGIIAVIIIIILFALLSWIIVCVQKRKLLKTQQSATDSVLSY